MAEVLLERIGMTGKDGFHTIHNYIDTDEMILRKGAIAAHAGEKVLIPINMRDGSVLAVGKGNAEWNYSAPHGAGRIMSRRTAKEQLSLEEYQETMIYTLYHNAEDVRSWIESQNQDDPDTCDVGFVLKGTGELTGSGGLYFKPDRDVWTIGYNLRADMWGNGYTVEAIQALIEHINSIHPIRVIEGEFAVENHNSQRVMEKLGMVYDREAEYEKMDGSVRFAAKVYSREWAVESADLR